MLEINEMKEYRDMRWHEISIAHMIGRTCTEWMHDMNYRNASMIEQHMSWSNGMHDMSWWMNAWMDEGTEWTHEWKELVNDMNEWIYEGMEWMNASCMNEGTNQCVNSWMDEWKVGWTAEINEWMSKWRAGNVTQLMHRIRHAQLNTNVHVSKPNFINQQTSTEIGFLTTMRNRIMIWYVCICIFDVVCTNRQASL